MKILELDEGGKRLLLGYAEAIGHCNLSQGPNTCCYLVRGPDGLECLFKNKPMKKEIDKRVKEKLLISQWLGCKWRWVLNQEKKQ
jgi:hypothetical protein